MLKPRVRNQYCAAIIINLAALNVGLHGGWPSSTFPLLQSKETPLACGPLSPEKLTWVASILFLGALLGLFIIGATVDRIGRKKSFVILNIIAVVSWLVIIFAQNIYYLLIARFLTGLNSGGISTVIAIYISEFAESRLRGKLDSFAYVMNYFGVLLAFMFGNYFSYSTYNTIYVLVPVSCLILITFVPETPMFLIRRNELKNAAKSLAFFRGVKKNAEVVSEIYMSELECLEEQSELQNGNNINIELEWKDFVTPNAKRAMVIGFGLILLSQLCGSVPIITYASTIFKDHGSFLEPSTCTVIVSIIQFVGSVTALILIERFGRKALLSASAAGAGIGLTVMGIYIYLKSSHYDIESYSAVLLCSFAFVVFVFPIGLSLLPIVILIEILPEKIRGPGYSVCVSLLWLLGYITSNYYYALTQAIGTHSCMFIFAGFCFLGAVGTLKFLIETKGKTLTEIQRLLSE